AESGGRDRKDRERRLLARTYLADGVLQKVDRASMAHGVEVRAPWLDRDVLALAYGLSSEQLVHGGRGKQIPRALATKYLPAPIVNRPKKGFGVPLSAWMRGPFASRMRHDLRPEAVQQVPGLDAKAITRWTERHIAGRADHRKTLFALWRLVRWWGALGS
ncbi:MAG: hypothetical protein KC502_21435, partial [Myxococcales bacterium]|nr:hypothetical protein [Myxococcales bacterium]